MSFKISQTFSTDTKKIKNYIEIDDDLRIEISKEDYEKIMCKYAQSIRGIVESGKAKLQIKDNKPFLIEDDGVEQL